MPADAVETAWLRASSLSALLGPHLVATHVTAAWIHGALAEAPARHSVARVASRRVHHVPERRIRFRDTRVDARDVESVAGVHVTTRQRTLADLARDIARGTAAPGAAAAASCLASVPGAPRAAIVCLAALGAVPGKPAALELLRRWEAEPPT